jgi:hypothetical protein
MRNLAPYSLRDITFTCSEVQRLPNGECPISNGVQVLDLYKLNSNPRMNIMWLGIVTLLYRIFADVLLKVMRMKWGGARRVSPDPATTTHEVRSDVNKGKENHQPSASET